MMCSCRLHSRCRLHTPRTRWACLLAPSLPNAPPSHLPSHSPSGLPRARLARSQLLGLLDRCNAYTCTCPVDHVQYTCTCPWTWTHAQAAHAHTRGTRARGIRICMQPTGTSPHMRAPTRSRLTRSAGCTGRSTEDGPSDGGCHAHCRGAAGIGTGPRTRPGACAGIG